MGEFFDDEEMEEQEEQEEQDDELDEEYNDIKEVVKERNRIRTELYRVIEDLKERIGRHNFSLFGDPRNPDAQGKLDLVEEELEYPNLRQHPIAKKMMAVVDEIRDLQREYKKLHRIYEANTKQMGNLLDNSLRLTLEGRKAEKESVNEPHSVTKEMVDTFMKNWGNELILKFNAAYENQSYDTAIRTKNAFVGKAETYFANVHDEPKEFGEELLDTYAAAPWSVVCQLYKKRDSGIENSKPIEKDIPQQSGLRKNVPADSKE